MRQLPTATLLAATLLFPASPSKAELPEDLDRNFQRGVENGDLIGAQVAAVRKGQALFAAHYGIVAPGSEKAVDDETVFLIGSCSKPFASICLLGLVADPSCDIELDSTIDRWLPAFAKRERQEGGIASRAPTVKELLCHRAGIFSQKVRITSEQAKWLYTFDHTLEKCVEEIARFPLLAEPGTRFAYSGAGYCVLGRVGELAAGRDFETILQESICDPVGLNRTTYFPGRHLPEATIAVGSQKQKAPHQLGDRHLFPLIGGSLYSTATEMALFGDAVAREWNGGKEGPFRIGQEAIRELARIDPEMSSYGLGWTVVMKNGEPAILSHGGSLQSYRAWIGVDLSSGTCLAACWTLGPNRSQVPTIKWLQESLDSL